MQCRPLIVFSFFFFVGALVLPSAYSSRKRWVVPLVSLSFVYHHDVDESCVNALYSKGRGSERERKRD